LLRFARSTPLHRHATERPLPHAPCGSCFGSEGTTLEIPFRPRGFAPPRRLPPLGGRGLVASRCQSWGSPRFRLSGSRPTPGRIQVPSGVPTPSPRRLFIPLEGFPSTAAAPRHRGRCPHAVLPDPAPHIRPPPLPESAFLASPDRSVGFEALLRCRVRNVRSIVANRETSSPSWASFPFKVLPDDETQPSSRSPHRVAPAVPEGTAFAARLLRLAPDIGTIPKERHRPGSAANAEALAGLAPKGRCRGEAATSGFRGADDIPSSIGRLLTRRANPIGKSRLRRSLSGAEVRDALPLAHTGCPVCGAGRHHRPSWGL